MQHYMYHTGVGVAGGLHQGFAPPAPPPIHPHSHSHSHSHHMTSLQGLQLAATTNAMVSLFRFSFLFFSSPFYPRVPNPFLLNLLELVREDARRGDGAHSTVNEKANHMDVLFVYFQTGWRSEYT